MRRAAIWVAAAVGAILICAPPARAQGRVDVAAATPYVGAQVTFAQRYSPPVYDRVHVSYDDDRGYRRGRIWAKRDRGYARDIRDARREYQRERRQAVREYRRDVQRAAREYARNMREARRDRRW